MAITKKTWKMIYSIVLTTGIVLLIISLTTFKNSLKLTKSGNKTIATVIDLQKNAENALTSIFKFTTYTGEAITFKGFGASSPPAFNIGEKVNIVYDPEKPGNAKVLTYFGVFGLAIILAAISMPMIIIGGGYFFTQQFLT